MAGHSHWAGIKHKKGRADKERERLQIEGAETVEGRRPQVQEDSGQEVCFGYEEWRTI